MRRSAVIALLSLLVGCSHGRISHEAQSQRSTGEFSSLLTSVGDGDVDVRRQAAADLCIALLKKNGVWRPDPLNWKMPTEEGICMEVKAVRTSKQAPDLAIANMCGHCMGMIKPGVWRGTSRLTKDPLEDAVIAIVARTDDAVVRIILLIGLASSQREAARDAIIAATDDPHLGVRKGACYLVERCARRPFGPIGNIHIGSPREDVDAAGRRIRNAYREDRALGRK